MFYLTDEQRDNLNKLADYLINLPEDYEHFDMAQYAIAKDADGMACEYEIEPSEVKEQISECGTVACALGHGPCAGIDPGFTNSWMHYSKSEFGIRWGTDEFIYLFGCQWQSVDNTPRGAGLRIKHFLAEGVPLAYQNIFPGTSNDL